MQRVLTNVNLTAHAFHIKHALSNSKNAKCEQHGLPHKLGNNLNLDNQKFKMGSILLGNNNIPGHSFGKHVLFSNGGPSQGFPP